MKLIRPLYNKDLRFNSLTIIKVQMLAIRPKNAAMLLIKS